MPRHIQASRLVVRCGRCHLSHQQKTSRLNWQWQIWLFCSCDRLKVRPVTFQVFASPCPNTFCVLFTGWIHQKEFLETFCLACQIRFLPQTTDVWAKCAKHLKALLWLFSFIQRDIKNEYIRASPHLKVKNDSETYKSWWYLWKAVWDRNLNCFKTCSEAVTGTGSSSSLSPEEEVAQRVEKSRRLTLSPPVTLSWMTSIVWTHTALEFVWPTPKLLCFLFVKSQRSVILSPFYCKQLTSSSSVESSSWQLTFASSVNALPRSGAAALWALHAVRAYQVVIDQRGLIIFKSEGQHDTC